MSYKYFVFILFLFTSQIYSQTLDLPRLSPKAEVKQQIGLSEITIKYCRPGVKGRKIWGGLVPFNNGIPFPWRAGANENTTIEISDDALVNGEPLEAGIYGFHIIPSPKEWILIFNKQFKSWGSFFYDSSYDALRIKVTPIENEFVERLEYGFEDLTINSTSVYMKWEKLKIKFQVKFDESIVVLNKIREQLIALPGMGWEGPMEAASYCLDNNINFKEALKWINISIERNPTFQNRIIKYQLLLKLGRDKEASAVLDKAIENSTEKELNDYSYLLLNENRIDFSLRMFAKNIKRHPKSWNCYDSYAEALLHAGKKDEAKKYYKKAIDLAPENQKRRIEEAIDKL